MINRKKLSVAVHSALVLGASTMMASAVQAQDAKTIDSVQVTGSRIKRVDIETSSPVFQIDRATIEKSGALTIGDFLQEIPSIAGAATNPQVNNGGGDGAATVSLRGLGSERTLLLINGRRTTYNDVNSIPMSMVQNIEVLKDGASAIYGSDAIGGVVNFILKSNFEGMEFSANWGIAGKGDGERYGMSSTLGIQGERGNLIVSVNYNKQKLVAAADRAFAHDALTLYAGSVTQGGSSRTTTGRYRVSETAAGVDYNGDGDMLDTVNVTRKDGFAGTSATDFRLFSNATDLFNYQAVGNVELTPQERGGMFVSGNFDITEKTTAYIDAFINRTRSAYQIAPLPFDGRPANDNIVLSQYSQYNPFGQDITDGRLRLSRIGNRRTDYSTQVTEINGGVKGSFGDTSWGWDASATFGKVDQNFTQTGYLFSAAMSAALGPSQGGVCYTDNTYTVAIPNCTPLDFFGAPPIAGTPAGDAQLAALAKVSPASGNHLGQWFRSLQANFSGDLFELGGGAAKGAFGIEQRKDSLKFVPNFLALLDPVTFTCQISSEACTLPVSGDVTTREVYAEVYLPFSDSFSVSVGTRHSDYSTFGSANNSKIGFEWRPSEQFLLRGTYAQVFRAPTINDLFAGRTASSDGFADPCNGQTVANNPACQNVPTDGSFAQSDTQLSAYRGGNPNLTPEEGTVKTFGFVYEPSWLTGFSTTVDFWQVDLENVIGNIGTQNILNNCYNSTMANPSPLCALFSRDANGEMERLFDDGANVGVWKTRGVDIGFKYRKETDFGLFRASLDTTYLDKFDTEVYYQGEFVTAQQLAGTFLSPANGGQGNYSKWRALGNLSWQKGMFDVSWNMRFVDGFQVGSEDPTKGTQTCADAAGYQGTSDPVARGYACAFNIGAYTYHNLQVGMTVDKVVVRLGVDNVFDKQPPILYQNNTLNGNTDERTFDTVGRYFWTSVTVNF